MKFETVCTNSADKAYVALKFLRDAYEKNKINEIENLEYVFECLDISQDLEYANRKLDEFYIEY